MTKSIHAQSSEELQKRVKKAIEARKIVRKTMNNLWIKAWDLKRGKWKLDWLIKESKEELGRRKAAKCGALKSLKKEEWGGSYSYFQCAARDLSYNYFRTKEEIWAKYCCTCKWRPSQAQTRMVILKIKNGGKIHKE